MYNFDFIDFTFSGITLDFPDGSSFSSHIPGGTFDVLFDTGAASLFLDEHIGEQVMTRINDILNISSPQEPFSCSLKKILPNLQFSLSKAQATFYPVDYVYDLEDDECLLMLAKMKISCPAILGMPFFLKFYTAFYLGDNPITPYDGRYIKFAEMKHC